MSGLGPAACWLAHKRIESWSRLAKERVGAVRKSTEKSEDKSSTASTSSGGLSINMSTESNNDSSTEVISHFLLLFLVGHLLILAVKKLIITYFSSRFPRCISAPFKSRRAVAAYL